MEKNSRLLAVILLMLSFGFLSAQTQNKKEDTEKVNKKHQWEMLGPHLYLQLQGGGTYSFTHVPSSIRYGGAFMLGYQFSPLFGLRGSADYMSLFGKGAYKKAYFTANEFKYKGQTADFSIEATFDLTQAFKRNPDRHYGIYPFIGIGATFYKSTLWNAETDAEIANREGDYPASSRFVGTVPVGLGFKYSFAKNWDVVAEYKINIANTDGIEINGTSDVMAYSMLSAGFKYKVSVEGDQSKKMAKNVKDVDIATTESVLMQKGDKVDFTVDYSIPKKYFKKRSVMQVNMAMVCEDGNVVPLKPVIFYGQKLSGEGIEVLKNAEMEAQMNYSIDYDPDMTNCMLVATPVIYKSNKRNPVKAYNSIAEIKDDYRKVHVTAPRDLAKGVATTQELVNFNEQVVAIAPNKYEPVILSSQTSNLSFKKNSAELSMADINKSLELVNELNSDLKNGIKIKDITINGFASPEGEDSFNQNLSEQRANNSKKLVEKQLIKDKISGIKVVAAGNGPDWNGFMKLVQESNFKDKKTILNIINSANPAQKETEIRNIILIYPEIEAEFLQPLRRSEISINRYDVEKTDSQILNMAINNYENLSFDELMYAGEELATTYKDKQIIYENIIRKYANQWEPYNNLGIIYINEGNLEDAEIYLDKANDLMPGNSYVLNNLGVLYSAMGDYQEANKYFTIASKAGYNTKYNQGLIEIMDGDYSEAITMMNKKCDYNVALAQVMNKDYAAAQNNLECCKQTAWAYYLKAIIGARTNNMEYLQQNLKKAVNMDPKLKTRASTDCEFYKYSNSSTFKSIINS